jgi:hypothetical protein
LATLSAALLIAGPLWAQQESVHLDYDVSAGCPDRDAFIAEVVARTSKARFVDDSHDVRNFKATIRTDAERTIGSLVSNSGQAGSERRVSGKTCTEVVSALALITALAIDPGASTQPSPPKPPEKAPTGSTETAPATSARSIVIAKPVTPPADAEPSATSTGALLWALIGEAAYGFTAEGAPLPMLGGSIHEEVAPFFREHRG